MNYGTGKVREYRINGISVRIKYWWYLVKLSLFESLFFVAVYSSQNLSISFKDYHPNYRSLRWWPETYHWCHETHQWYHETHHVHVKNSLSILKTCLPEQYHSWGLPLRDNDSWVTPQNFRSSVYFVYFVSTSTIL